MSYPPTDALSDLAPRRSAISGFFRLGKAIIIGFSCWTFFLPLPTWGIILATLIWWVVLILVIRKIRRNRH